MSLRDTHLRHGATLADDGIPLHYTDRATEYAHALQNAVLLDRSHQGRLRVTGKTCAEFLNRMSTNKLVNLADGEGRATIFTNENGRVIDRVMVYAIGDALLLITEPGRGPAVRQFLQSKIFFGDDVQVADITAQTALFGLHGPNADDIVMKLESDFTQSDMLVAKSLSVADATVTILRNKPLVGSHWMIICDLGQAPFIYEHVLAEGQPYALIPAGSLTYNVLRIRAGHPAAPEFANTIPLEIGLYDEVSFNKGCYTGQEIIARMDSRERIARALVCLELSDIQPTPVDIVAEGQKIGTLTSNAQAPDGTAFGLGLVKSGSDLGGTVQIGRVTAKLIGYAGTPPPFLRLEQHSASS
ncbi:MAG: aminomethyltransferase family protein [Anaerolineae bacterium]|nr:aminomethyltransferase family protein [Anaerolineae bacterium]